MFGLRITCHWRPRAKVPVVLLCVFSVYLSGLFFPIPIVEDISGPEEIEAQDEKKKRRRRKRRKRNRKEKQVSRAVIGGAGGVRSMNSDLSKPAGIDAVVILDASRSMTRSDPKRLRDQGAKLFLRFLTKEDRISVIQFDRKDKVVAELADVSVENLRGIDEAIDNIPVEGGFTNIFLPLRRAYKMLVRDGREKVVKAVILLSDGQMDPHPKEGSKDEMNAFLFDKLLPEYKKNRIKVYTLSLSDQADRELLEKIALQTDAQHWYAPDAETIHEKFSDLFLALKKPQVLPLDGEGFQIDPSVEEATFYVSTKKGRSKVTIVNPKGDSITKESLPIGVKWYSGDRFDVITIQAPIPGLWAVQGLSDPNGFATLLTDIKLQVRWPKTNLTVGDKMLVLARMMEGEKVFEAPGVDDLLYYTYKIIDTKTGLPVASGTFNDDGENGDEDEKDNIFSTSLVFNDPGEYKALVGVTSPTFTRNQQIPYTVATSIIELELKPPDEFSGKGERFEVTIGEEIRGARGLNVELVVESKELEQPISIPLKGVEDKDGVYDLLAEQLPAGELQVYAQAMVGRGKDVKVHTSKTIDYTADEKAPENVEPEDHTIEYIIFLVLSTIWAGALAWYTRRNFTIGKDRVEVIKKWQRPEELVAALEALTERASENKREPNDLDKAIVDVNRTEPIVADGGAAAAPSAEAGDGAEAEGEAEVEADTEGGDEEAPASEEAEAEAEAPAEAAEEATEEGQAEGEEAESSEEQDEAKE